MHKRLYYVTQLGKHKDLLTKPTERACRGAECVSGEHSSAPQHAGLAYVVQHAYTPVSRGAGKSRSKMLFEKNQA